MTTAADAHAMKWRVVGIALVVAVFLSLGSCTAFMLRGTGPAFETAEQFMTALSDEAWEDASALAAGCGNQSPAALERSFGRQNFDWTFTLLERFDGDATVTGSFRQTGRSARIEMTLREVERGWAVCTLQIF